ncbi:MAG: insulinase family protein [Myxococcota bacterium]
MSCLSKARLVVPLLLVLGCPPRTTQTSETTPASAETHAVQVRGVPLRVIPMESSGLVELRLYLSAGTLHAATPSAAVLAGWSLEDENTNVRVSADRIEIRRRLPSQELASGLEAMADALRRTEISVDAHAALLARWRESARYAAADPTRRADVLALRSLLGEAADPFSGRDATRADVAAFFQTHVGVGRALLLVVGDVDPDMAEDAARDALADLPRAEAAPEQAPPDPSEPALEEGTEVRFSVALEAGTRAAAHGLAERALRSRIADHAHVFPHPTGVALLLRTDALPRLRAALWLAHHGEPAPVDLPGDPMEAEVRAWISAEGERGAVQVGGVCPEGECEARVVAIAEEAARGETANVVVVPRRSREVAWSLRFASGGGSHGETAVLGRALAERCDCDVRFDATGLSLLGGGARWRADLQRTIDCITAGVDDATRARLQLVEQFRAAPERGWIAAALSPGLPSRVAPEGQLQSVADVTNARVRQHLRELRRTRRVTLAIAGAVNAEEGRRAAPMLASWGAGDEAPRLTWSEVNPVHPERWNGERPRVVVGWRSDEGGPNADVAAQAFARSIARGLAPYGRLLWHDGGGGRWGAWAAAALEMNEDDVNALEAIAARAVRQDPNLAEGIDRARWEGGNVREVAWRVSQGLPADLANDDPASILRSLRESAPVFVIGREQNSTAFRRLSR